MIVFTFPFRSLCLVCLFLSVAARGSAFFVCVNTAAAAPHTQRSLTATTVSTTDDTLLRTEIYDRIGRMTIFFHSMVIQKQQPSQEGLAYVYPAFYSHCYPQAAAAASSDDEQKQRLASTPALRDLGAAWDAVSVLQFWQQQQQEHGCPLSTTSEDANILEQAVRTTLDHYLSHTTRIQHPPSRRGRQQRQRVLLSDGGGVLLCLSSSSSSNNTTTTQCLNIAHSSFVVLIALGIHHHQLHNNNDDDGTGPTSRRVRDLVRGILAQQRADDGAFVIPYDDDDAAAATGDDDDEEADDSLVYNGIEFFPGEAMVGLMEFYSAAAADDDDDDDDELRPMILAALQRALLFYTDYFYTHTPDANYCIWQIQAFARLWHVLRRRRQHHDPDNSTLSNDNAAAAATVKEYVLAMCDRILASRSWKELARGRSFYPNLHAVEIACGLDAIAQGIRILEEEDDNISDHVDNNDNHHDVRYYWIQAKNAVEYLGTVQDQIKDPAAVGYGGLGYGGVQALEQRLDVTGHALSAFIQLHQLLLLHKSKR